LVMCSRLRYYYITLIVISVITLITVKRQTNDDVGDRSIRISYCDAILNRW